MPSRSRSPLLYATIAMFALLVGTSPARADNPVRGEAFCFESLAASTSLNSSYVTCSAHYNGVPAPQTTLDDPFAGYGDFKFVGQTRNNSVDSGPFEPFGAGFGIPFDTLAMKATRSGPFIIALASAGDYSLYLYDPSKAGGAAVSSITFSTFGTTNIVGGPFELQYANLYAAIPEPTSLALVLGGLGAIGLGLRRNPR